MTLWKILFPSLAQEMDRLNKEVLRLTKELNNVPETIESVKQKLTAVSQELVAGLGRVQADVDFLKSKIPPGGSITITQADLDSLGAGLDSALAAAKSLDPIPDNPPPPPPPAEPPAEPPS